MDNTPQMKLSPRERADALTILADLEGYEINEMLEEATYDSIAWGICTSCLSYTTQVEPDCHACYCEDCQTQTVRSCLSLAGLI